ncbi:uncharacterized protein IAS62_002438 [Cryptococcus decagattii]|uniref:Uncharacterized protein n=1 Tax=Cryptococcus decagattii TaxID=1859122 RepID=A0ABZ2ARI0_9TREE
MLGIFKVVEVHGWTLVESIEAGGSKMDTHDLLFSYSSEITLAPPSFLPSQFLYLTVSPSSTPHSNPPQPSSRLSAHPSSPPPHSSSNNLPTGLSTQLPQ